MVFPSFNLACFTVRIVRAVGVFGFLGKDWVEGKRGGGRERERG